MWKKIVKGSNRNFGNNSLSSTCNTIRNREISVSFSTGTLEVLFELGWVKPQGRKNIPGKPLVYATSDIFLSHFNINSIDDLPNSEELMAAGLIDNRVDSSIFGTPKFAEQDKDKVEKNSYTNIDDMINDTLEKKNNSCNL